MTHTINCRDFPEVATAITRKTERNWQILEHLFTAVLNEWQVPLLDFHFVVLSTDADRFLVSLSTKVSEADYPKLHENFRKLSFPTEINFLTDTIENMIDTAYQETLGSVRSSLNNRMFSFELTQRRELIIHFKI